MLKILKTSQIREADAYTIENEPVSSGDLMERAGFACFRWIVPRLNTGQRIKIFCGQGNNGGDGLVIARLLSAMNIPVEVFPVITTGKFTEDFRTNMERLVEQGLAEICEIHEASAIPVIHKEDLVIDALLGSGLSNSIKGLLADVISTINEQEAVVISIDIASGLFSDQFTDPKAGAVVKADYTLCFQVPRLAFFFPENEIYIGDWHVLDIGLHASFLENAPTLHFLVGEQDVSSILPPRTKFAHKGQYGHGLLIAGSYGKMGAAVLSAKAALRSGAGLITAHIPAKGYNIIQTALPEAMADIDHSDLVFSSLPDLSPYNAIAVGPGIGKDETTAKALKLLIQNYSHPMILDADALNILGENKTWLSFLPRQSILTPHLKEFERITRKVGNSFERNQVQREFSVKYGLYVILKGAFTCISFPDGRCYFNPTGNPGMATGGSGDVLTGILLGLMSRGLSPASACLLGVYLHGLAGDIASSEKGYESLIAGDIIENLGAAFNRLVSSAY